ncbi:hypothetical protein BDV98DRAFT_577465 [Pterulicium gracile]|uniref:Uncharacterized protein n=1 Tax=Pterulicium gracile TaxID=1884261 RepID=A0A5C3QAW4_9AGAR|nr:hypothetical protein BDV98DRAFT_577465 [Pterula gracilis]
MAMDLMLHLHDIMPNVWRSSPTAAIVRPWRSLPSSPSVSACHLSFFYCGNSAPVGSFIYVTFRTDHATIAHRQTLFQRWVTDLQTPVKPG